MAHSFNKEPTPEPEDADDTSDDPPQPLPTRTEVDNALAILLRHAEGTNGMTCTDLDNIMKYHTAVTRCRTNNTKQQSIMSFFS